MPTVGGIVVATGTQSTGRRTFNEVKAELARPVNASDSTTLALAGDAFRAAIRRMNRKGNWPWEIQDEDISITANNNFSTVSSRIKKPLAMHFLNSTGGTRDQRIQYIEYDIFMEQYNLNVTSQPFAYTIPNLFETGQIRWYPTPSANDDARFTFYRVTPAPRNEQEVIEVPDYALEAYMSMAWLEFLKRLPSEARPFPISIAMSEAKQAFAELSAHVSDTGDMARIRDMGTY